jgi:hypothetical protein
MVATIPTTAKYKAMYYQDVIFSEKSSVILTGSSGNNPIINLNKNAAEGITFEGRKITPIAIKIIHLFSNTNPSYQSSPYAQSFPHPPSCCPVHMSSRFYLQPSWLTLLY